MIALPNPGDLTCNENEPRLNHLLKSLKALLHPIQKLKMKIIINTNSDVHDASQRKKCLEEMCKNREETSCFVAKSNKNP